MIISSGRYVHETHKNGFEKTDEWSRDEAAQWFPDLVDSIGRKPLSSGADKSKIFETTQERLEDLGYA